MKAIYSALILLIISLALAACNLPGRSSQNASAIATSAAQTVQAVLSPAASPAVTQLPPTQPLPTLTATTEKCEDNAKYTAWTRNNILYDAKETKKSLAPGVAFNMSWTFQNIGSCTWNSAYKMYFDSGAPLTGATGFPILEAGKTVAPGGTVTLALTMTAPAQAGDYQSTYRLQNDQGQAVITLGIITTVGSGGSSQTLPAPGNLHYTYDCTSGSVNVSLFWVDNASGAAGYHVYRDGAQVAELPAGSATYTETVPSTGSYAYKVTAFDSSTQSSATVTVSTSGCN